MKICIIGTGYVGLVSGICLAEMGNDVILVDKDQQKIRKLEQGISPIYEPGLEQMIKNNIESKRVKFTTDLRYGIENSLIIFIAVGTPSLDNGSADLSYVFDVAEKIGLYMNSYKIVVNKSTVPIGTAEKVQYLILEQQRNKKVKFEFDVVSNPEFLKEGAAIEDFMRPDRVVIGTDNVRTAEIMKQLYDPFVRNGHPIIIMDVKSSEMTKYAANCMLATKISFMNELSKLCEMTGADITKVRQGIGTDGRIGMQFLYAGLGYGGSCFPKDIKSLIKIFEDNDMESKILKSVDEINTYQRMRFVQKVLDYYNNDLIGRRIAIWGLAFKPSTDDMREAPSIEIIKKLITKGCILNAYDLKAVDECKKIFGDKNESINYFDDQYEALKNCDALIIITEWNSFKNPDFKKISSSLNKKVIFDGRNLYDPTVMKQYGFEYISVGR